MTADPDTKAAEAPEAGADAAVAAEGEGTLLDRIEELPQWRPDAVPEAERAGRSMPLDPAVEVEPILPDGWRDQPRRRRRTRRKQKRRGPRPWVRRARWSLVSALLLGGVVAAALLIWVPQYVESLAEGVVDDYREGLDLLQERIPPMEASLPELARADLTGPDLEEIQPVFARLRTAALSLSDTVRDPLPETPPLLPRDIIDELAPVRARIALVAGRADVVTGRIGRVVRYRTLLQEAFALPAELPTVAEPLEVNDLSLTLAAMLADSLDVVSRLPSEPFLDAHRAEVQETLEWFRTWEIDYLQALRREGSGAAATLVSSARSRVGRVQLRLGAPLAEFEAWAEAELASLAADLATARILVVRADGDNG